MKSSCDGESNDWSSEWLKEEFGLEGIELMMLLLVFVLLDSLMLVFDVLEKDIDLTNCACAWALRLAILLILLLLLLLLVNWFEGEFDQMDIPLKGEVAIVDVWEAAGAVEDIWADEAEVEGKIELL